jgi:polyhydroxyalkanoate synthesis regulator phasin
MNSKDVFSSLVGITFLVLIVFGVLQWLQIPKGTMIDWVIGIAAFWWLLIIVTLPWNMHFQAKAVLDDVKLSQEKDIKVNEADIEYVKKIASRYLIIAIVLHLISAGGLYGLAFFEVSSLGYWGAGLALLLMGLRPAIRMQAYIIDKLYSIRKEVLYPREDAYELRTLLADCTARLEKLEYELDKSNPESFITTQTKENKALQGNVQALRKRMEDLEVQNQTEHEKLRRKSEDAMAKLAEDTQFLGQVRDLIRFIKNA